MKCPECGGHEFRVEVWSMAEVRWDPETKEDTTYPALAYEWDAGAWTVCNNCEFEGEATCFTRYEENAA